MLQAGSDNTPAQLVVIPVRHHTPGLIKLIERYTELVPESSSWKLRFGYFIGEKHDTAKWYAIMQIIITDKKANEP
ncbi:hypothetical protein RvY_16306 [Ramazzottius varieornatus]|uniref:Uncharacterized protein n=1 Tax=Ramazzottius varieornatus TaxID=947166 RepID=A0A1D1VY10_RAMVA|nr:hypothetical protein RvY_16306 [Ramazzottius varieornatus]